MKKISLFITFVMLITAFAMPMNAVAAEENAVSIESVQEENSSGRSESPDQNEMNQPSNNSNEKASDEDNEPGNRVDEPANGAKDLLANNISIGNGLIANFKYEKTIDMTSASNRKNIPNVDFDFTLYAIPQSEQSKYGIGEVFGDPEGEKGARKVVPGNLGKKISSKHFSRVSFRSTDGYDPELTKLMASKDVGEKVINHILKYDWGEMRSSDHGQTAITRKPSPEEKKWLDEADPDDNCHTWPADTIGWKMSQEHDPDEEYPGSYEEGCQLLWEYDFDTFDYVKTFTLHANRAVTYYAYTYRRPLLTHCIKDKTGKYKSISKGLLTATEYEKLCDQLSELNPYPEDDSGYKLSYRFLLKENQVKGSKFKANSETKIVDWFPSDGTIAIFDSLKDAKESYNKIVTDTENGYINRLDEKNIFPDSSFTNKYISIDKEKPVNENKHHNKKIKKVKSSKVVDKVPETGDRTNIGLWIGIVVAAIAVLAVIFIRRRIRR